VGQAVDDLVKFSGKRYEVEAEDSQTPYPFAREARCFPSFPDEKKNDCEQQTELDLARMWIQVLQAA
jgi:hypothetical protein